LRASNWRVPTGVVSEQAVEGETQEDADKRFIIPPSPSGIRRLWLVNGAPLTLWRQRRGNGNLWTKDRNGTKLPLLWRYDV